MFLIGVEPDAPPQNFTAFNTSSKSIRMEFKPVPKDFINGILRGYRVFFFKTRDGNLTTKNLTIGKVHDVHARRKKRSADEFYEDIPLFFEIPGLQEYTNYTTQIQAITIGGGVLTEPYTTLTGEDSMYLVCCPDSLLFDKTVTQREVC